jgi:8-amino-7-oxononanoate synthase
MMLDLKVAHGSEVGGVSRTEGLRGDLPSRKTAETKDRDVFAKAARFTDIAFLRSAGFYPFYQVVENSQSTTARIGGRDCVMLGSNDYLGLTAHPEVRQAAATAALEQGSSLTGSRLLNGTHILHQQLEAALAEFFGKPAALVFSTGYQANLGVLSALVGKNDFVLVDRMNHASIFDGAALCKGKLVVFAHNDMASLESKLASLPEDAGKLIVVDGVFSMEGDLCNLPEIVAIAERFGARVMVDDAHGVGVHGPGGRGTAHRFGLADKTDLIVGTFSKSLASIGGFVVGESDVIEYIRHFGRSVLFSASMPPASAAAALKSLEILRREPERVERVQANAKYLRESLLDAELRLGPTDSPIIPIIIGDELTTLRLWRDLLDSGVYVNAVLHPAVPRDSSLLRSSCSSQHTREHLDRAISVLTRLAPRGQDRAA